MGKELLLERYNILGTILDDFSYNAAFALDPESILPSEVTGGMDMETMKQVIMTERIQTLRDALNAENLTDIISTDDAAYQAREANIPQDAAFAQNKSTLTALESGWRILIQKKALLIKINYEAERQRKASDLISKIIACCADNGLELEHGNKHFTKLRRMTKDQLHEADYKALAAKIEQGVKSQMAEAKPKPASNSKPAMFSEEWFLQKMGVGSENDSETESETDLPVVD